MARRRASVEEVENAKKSLADDVDELLDEPAVEEPEAEALRNASDGSYEMDGKLADEAKPTRSRRAATAKPNGVSQFVPLGSAGEELVVASGEEVEVTWGREVYTPKQYHTIEVGPFKSTGKIQAGESRGEAIQRIHAELDTAARAIVTERLKAFRENYGGK